jgi:hypothetical protein
MLPSAPLFLFLFQCAEGARGGRPGVEEGGGSEQEGREGVKRGRGRGRGREIEWEREGERERERDR